MMALSNKPENVLPVPAAVLTTRETEGELNDSRELLQKTRNSKTVKRRVAYSSLSCILTPEVEERSTCLDVRITDEVVSVLCRRERRREEERKNKRNKESKREIREESEKEGERWESDDKQDTDIISQ